jgi:hypothetical protein
VNGFSIFFRLNSLIFNSQLVGNKAKAGMSKIDDENERFSQELGLKIDRVLYKNILCSTCC